MSASLLMSRDSERNWAAFAHLSALLGYFTVVGFWLGPLVTWLVFQDRSRTVSDHAKEALNFNLSLLIYALIIGMLCFMLIGFLFLPIIVVVQLVLPIVAAIAAKDGKPYRYPLTLRLVS